MQTNHDLGHGWWANWTHGDQETLTLRNGDIGLRIDLPTESLKTLRDILKTSREEWIEREARRTVRLRIKPGSTVRGIKYFESALLDVSPNLAAELIDQGIAERAEP